MGQESGLIDTVGEIKEGECRTVFSAVSKSLVLDAPGVWGRQVDSRALFCYSKSLEGVSIQSCSVLLLCQVSLKVKLKSPKWIPRFLVSKVV